MIQKIPRSSARASNALNRPPRQTSVHRPELHGRPRRNMIIPSEQTSESSNDSNDDTITNHDSVDENSEHPVPVATYITPV